MGLIRDISLELQMSEQDIGRIIATAPNRYKVFAIPKRTGIEHRIIAQPARELKAIQRYLVENRLAGLRIHQMATAYQPGKNILSNAYPHRKKRVILKLDFRDFFHSIVPADLKAALTEAGFQGVAPAEWHLLAQLFFWRHYRTGSLCLSIGAPSSPFISNLIMGRLDRECWQICKNRSVVATRYADDITLSGNSIENLLAAEKEIRTLVARSRRPKLSFNDDKRGLFTTAGRRMVTGLVVTPDGKISLGRERKRKISAALHHIAVGKNVTAEHIAKTQGWLAYAKSVEPSFFQAMVLKYESAARMVVSAPFLKAVNADQLANIDF